jgi:hypothetical protein
LVRSGLDAFEFRLDLLTLRGAPDQVRFQLPVLARLVGIDGFQSCFGVVYDFVERNSGSIER